MRALLAFLALSTAVQGSSIPNLLCSSASPIWSLHLLGNTAVFEFADRTIHYDLMDETVAQPGPWPIALTFLAPQDTAIVLVRSEASEFSVDILTQRRNLPVLFSGACKLG